MPIAPRRGSIRSAPCAPHSSFPRTARTWAKRSHPEPIENEEHFLFVKEKYIPAHVHEGAAVYSIHIAGKQQTSETPHASTPAKPTH